jgi:hypothetical protein
VKRVIAVAVLGVFCGSAMANGTAPASAKANATGGKASATGVGIASARSTASAGATALGGAGGQGFGGAGGQGFGGTASAAGGSVNYSIPAQQTITSNGRVQVESVPNVYAPNIYPTSTCMGSSSAGAGWLGFGMTGGTSWEAVECQIQEASRNAPTAEDRVYVWCKSAHAKGSPSCKLYENAAVTNAEVEKYVDRNRRNVPAQSQVWNGGE